MAVMHVWYLGLRRHPREIAGKNVIRPLFLLFFCFSVESNFGFLMGWGSSLAFLDWSC